MALKHSTVIVTGFGNQRRARVLSIVETFPADEQDAAAMLRQLFEEAAFDGYAKSRFERGFGCSRVDMTLSERACQARRRLNWFRERVPSDLWAVLWFRLFAEEVDSLVSARLDICERTVKRRLRDALRWVAGLRNATR